MREPKGWDKAANGCKILRRRRGIQPPFPLMSKEKAAGGEKETSKGGFASEQTPHPSSCPFRCSSSSHTNRFAGFAWEPSPPLQTPLKRPRRGQRPPSLDFPRGLVRAEIISDLQNAIQMRIWQTDEVIEILCGKVGRTVASAPTSLWRLETLRIPYVKYSTGADRTTCMAYRALGKPDSTAARRAFLAGRIIVEWHAEAK